MNLDLFGNEVLDAKRTMSDYFGVPPFSILNTVDGEWQARKKRWNNLINDTGNSRENTLVARRENATEVYDKIQNLNNGVSILDACMAELLVKWFTEEGFNTFDPFAGDAVFGFVSAFLKRPFTGIELRKEQADFNQMQCTINNLPAQYFCDNSENMDRHIPDNSKDFIFSCPPYADLEVYSDLPEDLSTMSHDDFFKVYKAILQKTYAKLKAERFAVIVTSEVRNKAGHYIQLVPKTIDIMVEAGYIYYNDIVLVNSAGTLPLRVGKYMNTGRKVGRRHQNILVFYKGNPKNIRNNFSEIIPKNKYYDEEPINE